MQRSNGVKHMTLFGSCRITPRRRFCSAIPKDNKMLKIKNKHKSMVTTLSPADNSLLVLRLLRLISRNLCRGCRSCLNNLPARWQFFNLERESRKETETQPHGNGMSVLILIPLFDWRNVRRVAKFDLFSTSLSTHRVQLNKSLLLLFRNKWNTGYIAHAIQLPN